MLCIRSPELTHFITENYIFLSTFDFLGVFHGKTFKETESEAFSCPER